MTATDTTTGRRSAANTATAQDPENPSCTERTTRSMPIIPATAAQVVRQQACSRCGAPRNVACQASPPADHVARWLDTFTARLITRADVTEVLMRLVVLTDWALIPADAAERAA